MRLRDGALSHTSKAALVGALAEHHLYGRDLFLLGHSFIEIALSAAHLIHNK
jgi:hypothetical protein